MNTLSWLIYLAGVTGNLGAMLAICGGLGIIGCTISIFVHGAKAEWRDDDYEKEKRVAFQQAQRNSIKWLIAPILCLLLSCLLPSSGTVYAIAASEMGEEVLNSETGGKAVQALNAWLDRQINPAPKPAG